MVVAAPTQPNVQPVAEPLRLYRLSVEQYHRMAEQGILTSADRVELLDGFLVEKMTINPAHSLCVQLFQEWLVEKLPREYRLRIQQPITMQHKQHEPEPDLAIVMGEAKRFQHRHPSPAEVRLVVEVADSSLSVDRDVKAKLYAEAGILEYWLVNLVERCVQVYMQPTPQGYGQVQVLQPADALVLSLHGQEVSRRPVAELLPGP